MLLSIFVFLVLFSLILIVAGYYIEAPVTQIAGTAVMFIAGLLLMFSTVEYASGETELYIYGNNFTGYHWDYDYTDAPDFNQTILNTPEAVFLFHKNTTTVYDSWDEELVAGIGTRHTVAFVLLVTSILVFISVLSQTDEGLPDER